MIYVLWPEKCTARVNQAGFFFFLCCENCFICLQFHLEFMRETGPRRSDASPGVAAAASE